jgi:ATP-binding cassette subfamily B protein
VRFLNFSAVQSHTVARGTARRALGFARPYRQTLAFYLGVIVLDSAVVAASPLFIRAIIDVLQSRSPSHDEIVVLAVALGAILLADQILSVIGVRLSSRIGQGIIFDLRTAAYRHIQRLSVGFFTRVQTGALMSRLDNDVTNAQQAFSDLLSVVVGSAISIGASLVIMALLSWQITLIALIALPFGAVFARFAGRRVAGLSRANLQLLSKLSVQMSERFNVGGALLITLFGRREKDTGAYVETSAEIRQLSVTMATYTRMFSAALLCVSGLITAVIYGWGGVLTADHTIALGTIVALASYITRLYGPLISLSNAPLDVMNSLVSFERLFEVLDLEPSLTERDDARDIAQGPCRLVFESVDFTYPGRDTESVASLEPDNQDDAVAPEQVLFDVSFVAEPGQTVALVGPTGAGKTTAALLARRLYDASSGAVTLNGLDVRDASFSSLQQRVLLVTQDAFLLHASIRENLQYAAPSASDDELRSVLGFTQLLATVDAMPHGLDTIVGDRGFRLSGGEKQRLALARAVLARPSLVILDEATAQLDARTERAVHQALSEAWSDCTVLVIAHQLDTIQSADRIVVLGNGHVVEQGSHTDLMAAGGLYHELVSARTA